MQSTALPGLGLALDKGQVTVVAADPAEPYIDQLTTRTVNAQASPQVSAPTVVESLPGLNRVVATGDGQVAFDYEGQTAKTDGTANSFAGIPTASGAILDADGRYVLTGSGSSVQAGDFTAQQLLGRVQSSPTGAASVWGGYAYVGESAPAGAVGVIDLAKQRVAATLGTGAPCSVTGVQVTDRWLYWVCDTHTAGIYDLATGARFELPTTGSGYDDALLGDGYLVYHDPAAQQLVIDDIHTDQLVSSSAFATPAQGDAVADHGSSWTVDRYSQELAWQDSTGSYHVAPVDVPASAAWTFHYTAPTVPAWLVPLASSTSNQSTWRECTGVRISPSRILGTADCYLGHGSTDYDWTYTGSGQLYGGGSNPTYLLDQHDNAGTGQGDLSVTGGGYSPSRSVAPLAGAADSALYRPGTAATFYSWSGLGWSQDQRTPHSESAVVGSAASCAALLGHALPAGSICTSPAPGSLYSAQDHCTGDAGGALVAGGKVIATAATSATGCSAAGVRLYTAVAPAAALIVGWGRDLGIYEDGVTFGGIVARESNGVIYAFCSSDMKDCLDQGVGTLIDGSNLYNEVIPAGDMDGDGQADLLARTTSGALYRFWGLGYGTGDLDGKDKVWLGNGWNSYRTILAPGDLTGDGIGDVIAVDYSGVMWLYPGTAKGGLGARIRVSGGWNTYNLITGGDVTGDGIADLVARDAQGRLWTYVGNGKGGFQTQRVYDGAGWGGLNALVIGGDLDQQGHEQMIGRTPSGACYLYSANGAGGFSYNGAVGGNSWIRTAALT
ncbi:trypsin-like serine protease [Streptacidiphilus sp. 4-A2]|nr:trypsin-like serine protease [Streptacidiphilus sp. 4-A2]